MTRTLITANHPSITHGILHVVAISKRPSHLWLNYTTKRPTIYNQRDARSNSTVPHQINFGFQIEGQIEQEEPGETTTHTYTFPWPFPSTVIWYYFVNSPAPPLKPSRSPIFCLVLTYGVIWEETWPGPGPDKPWLFSPFESEWSRTLGNGQLTYTWASPFHLPSLSINANIDPTFPSNPPADLVIELNPINVQIAPSNAAFAYFRTEVQDYSLPFDPNFSSFFMQLDGPPCSPGQLYIRGFISSTGKVLIQGAGLNLPGPYYCGDLPQFAPNPNLFSLDFGCSGGAFTPPQKPGIWSMGPIRIYAPDGNLKDISGSWRYYGLPSPTVQP